MSAIQLHDIFADDLERARRFYENVFGWRHEKHESEERWLFSSAADAIHAVRGSLSRRGAPLKVGDPQPPVHIYVVKDIENSIRLVELHKGKCVRPKHAEKGVGWHCHCMDTEGNIFGLLQHDPDAE